MRLYKPYTLNDFGSRGFNEAYESAAKCLRDDCSSRESIEEKFTAADQELNIIELKAIKLGDN